MLNSNIHLGSIKEICSFDVNEPASVDFICNKAIGDSGFMSDLSKVKPNLSSSPLSSNDLATSYQSYARVSEIASSIGLIVSTTLREDGGVEALSSLVDVIKSKLAPLSISNPDMVNELYSELERHNSIIDRINERQESLKLFESDSGNISSDIDIVRKKIGELLSSKLELVNKIEDCDKLPFYKKIFTDLGDLRLDSVSLSNEIKSSIVELKTKKNDLTLCNLSDERFKKFLDKSIKISTNLRRKILVDMDIVLEVKNVVEEKIKELFFEDLNMDNVVEYAGSKKIKGLESIDLSNLTKDVLSLKIDPLLSSLNSKSIVELVDMYNSVPVVDPPENMTSVKDYINQGVEDKLASAIASKDDNAVQLLSILKDRIS